VACRVVALAVVGVLVCGSSLAHAGPPDPTWIAGFWDDTDSEDVIVRITPTSSAIETRAPCALEPR
jgi:hypothetical protein